MSTATTEHVHGCLCYDCILERRRVRIAEEHRLASWSAVDLRTMTRNAMIRNGLSSDDVRRFSDDELLTYRNVGRGTVEEIRAALAPPPAWTVIC